MNHEAWLHVWGIGQQKTQCTTWSVDLTTIDWLIEKILRMKQSPMLYVLEVIQNAASEDIDLDADQVNIAFIWMISPQALRSAVIGQ